MLSRALLYSLAMIVLWGSHAAVAKMTLGAYASDPLPRQSLVFLNQLWGSAFLFLVVLATGRMKVLRGYSWGQLGRLAFAGVFGGFLYYFFLFWAFELAPPDVLAEANIINYLFPIVTVIVSALIIPEKLTTRAIVSVVISFIGAYVVVSRGAFDLSKFAYVRVDLLAFAAAVAWGVFSSLGRKFSPEPITGMFVYITTGLALSACMLPFANGRTYPVGWEIYGTFHIGVLCNSLGVIMWFQALRYGGAALVGNLSYFACFASLGFIWLLLAEPVSVWSILGLCVITVGVFLSRSGRPAAPLQPDSGP